MKDMARKICDSNKSLFPTTPSIKPKLVKKMERHPQRLAATELAVNVSDDGNYFYEHIMHTVCDSVL